MGFDLGLALGGAVKSGVDTYTRLQEESRQQEAEKRAHILQGYLIALDNLDEVIKLIRESRDPEIAKNGLMTVFGMSLASVTVPRVTDPVTETFDMMTGKS